MMGHKCYGVSRSNCVWIKKIQEGIFAYLWPSTKFLQKKLTQFTFNGAPNDGSLQLTFQSITNYWAMERTGIFYPHTNLSFAQSRQTLRECARTGGERERLTTPCATSGENKYTKKLLFGDFLCLYAKPHPTSAYSLRILSWNLMIYSLTLTIEDGVDASEISKSPHFWRHLHHLLGYFPSQFPLQWISFLWWNKDTISLWVRKLPGGTKSNQQSNMFLHVLSQIQCLCRINWIILPPLKMSPKYALSVTAKECTF